jgi:hypothetical protein
MLLHFFIEFFKKTLANRKLVAIFSCRLYNGIPEPFPSISQPSPLMSLSN